MGINGVLAKHEKTQLCLELCRSGKLWSQNITQSLNESESWTLRVWTNFDKLYSFYTTVSKVLWFLQMFWQNVRKLMSHLKNYNLLQTPLTPLTVFGKNTKFTSKRRHFCPFSPNMSLFAIRLLVFSHIPSEYREQHTQASTNYFIFKSGFFFVCFF